MQETANDYNLQGLRLFNLGRYEEAIDFFTKAIEKDPDFSNAYQNRGEAYIRLDRYVEGNTDIQRAKNILSGKHKSRKKKKKKTVKLNVQEFDDVYDTIFSDDVSGGSDNPSFEIEDNLYDYVFSDDVIKDDKTWEGIAQAHHGTDAFPSILEYVGGKRREVAGAILFKPTRDTISVIGKDGSVEHVIPLEQLACIRMAGVPEQLAGRQEPAGYTEVIETVDGNLYHEIIHPEQDLDNLLFGFSTKEQTRFTFSFIPRLNIKKRCQQRLLGEILLEKRYIAGDILKNALDEFHHAKNQKLGRIIAQKAHILYSAIEEQLEKAKLGATGLKTGEILLASGLVNEEQVLEALEYQETVRNLKIGEFLIEKGIVQEREIYVSLAEKHRFPFIDLRKQRISKKTLLSFPKDLVIRNEILPIGTNKGMLLVAIHSVELNGLCEEILKTTKCRQVRFGLTQPTHIKNIISLFYRETPVNH